MPKDVAEVIQDAVANGWDPLTTEKDLHITGDFGSPHEFFNEDLCDG